MKDDFPSYVFFFFTKEEIGGGIQEVAGRNGGTK